MFNGKSWTIGAAALVFFAGCEPSPGTKDDASGIRGMAEKGPKRQDDAVVATQPSVDTEPNDRIDQAVVLEIPDGVELFSVTGVLTGGGSDTDIFKVPAQSGVDVASVKVAPERGGDLIVGLSTGSSLGPALIDSAVAGTAEHVPNFRVVDGGFIHVTGRGPDDLPYRIDLVFKSSGGREEAEPNDRIAEAHTVTGNTVAYANRSGDLDHFKVISQGPGASALTLTPPSSSAIQISLRMDGQEIWNPLIQNGKAETFRGIAPGKELALRVEVVGEVTFPDVYQIQLVAMEGEGRFEYEPNNEPGQAQVIGVGEDALRAAISSPEDRDHFRIEIPAGDGSPYVFHVEASPLNPEMKLKMTARLVELGLQERRGSNALPGLATGLCNVATQGTTTAEIVVESEIPGDYELRVAARPLDGEEKEPNFTMLTAGPILSGERVKGFIHPSGDVDLFSFEIPVLPSNPTAVAPVDVRTIGAYPADLRLSLKTVEMGKLKRVGTRNDGLRNEPEHLSMSLPPGLYFVELSALNDEYSCKRPYELKVKIASAYLDQVGSGATPTAPAEPTLEPKPEEKPAVPGDPNNLPGLDDPLDQPVDGPGDDGF